MKLLSLFCFLSLFSSSSFTQIHYYSKDFYELGLDKSIDNFAKIEIRRLLKNILDYTHVKTTRFDIIEAKCPPKRQNFCYKHVHLDYSREVRPLIMAILPKKESGTSTGKVNTPYCDEYYEVKKINNRYIFPEHTKFNVEHTWPKSKFNKRYDRSLQKSDLYNLYPVLSKANSHRGSFHFGEFKGHDHPISFCQASELGHIDGAIHFEPPADHKGNVARSVFYFALKYEIKITHAQLKMFQKWHLSDPVDEEERERANLIYKFQKNRNPFIDFPHLTEIFI